MMEPQSVSHAPASLTVEIAHRNAGHVTTPTYRQNFPAILVESSRKEGRMRKEILWLVLVIVLVKLLLR